MQDEINEKTIALYIKTGKLTAQTLQKAMKTLLAQMKKQKDKTPQGKQTLKQLMKQNAGVSNIEITEGNIKAFESTAKKYGIDFALKKDTTESPPRYLVFFKGRDADVLTAAFKEFSAKKLTQEKKPSIRKLLSCLQNAVYVLLDNVIFPDFLFQLAIIGVKGFFLRLECFIFLLQRGGIGELCNARRFECLCRSFMEDNIALMSGAVSLFVLCLAVCVIDRLCLLIGGNILDKHRHFRKPLFGVLQCVCRLSAFRCHFLNPAD